MSIVFTKRLARHFLIAAAAIIGQAAAAQSADDHAAHHPGGAATSDAAPQTVSPSPIAAPSGANPMSKIMDEMMGGEMQMGKQTSTYSALLAFPELDRPARERAAVEANARVHRGLRLASEVTSKAHGPGETDGTEIATQLREAAALIESGSATTAVLNGQRSGASVANEWFRLETGLTPADTHASMAGRLWGLTPGHWLFMAATLLALGALLALQMLRLRRVRALVVPVPHAAPATDLAGPSPIAPGQAIASPRISGPTSKSARHPDLSGLAPTGKPRPWSGELRVAQIFNETPTVKTFRLVLPGSDRLPFDFLPGQFLQIAVLKEDGTKAKRS